MDCWVTVNTNVPYVLKKGDVASFLKNKMFLRTKFPNSKEEKLEPAYILF